MGGSLLKYMEEKRWKYKGGNFWQYMEGKRSLVKYMGQKSWEIHGRVSWAIINEKEAL